MPATHRIQPLYTKTCGSIMLWWKKVFSLFSFLFHVLLNCLIVLFRCHTNGKSHTNQNVWFPNVFLSIVRAWPDLLLIYECSTQSFDVQFQIIHQSISHGIYENIDTFEMPIGWLSIRKVSFCDNIISEFSRKFNLMPMDDNGFICLLCLNFTGCGEKFKKEPNSNFTDCFTERSLYWEFTMEPNLQHRPKLLLINGPSSLTYSGIMDFCNEFYK